MKNIKEFLLSKDNNKLANDFQLGDVVKTKFVDKTTFLIVNMDEDYLYVFHLFKNPESYTYDDFKKDMLLVSWCTRDDITEKIGHLDLDERTIRLFQNMTKSK